MAEGTSGAKSGGPAAAKGTTKRTRKSINPSSPEHKEIWDSLRAMRVGLAKATSTVAKDTVTSGELLSALRTIRKFVAPHLEGLEDLYGQLNKS